MRDYWWSCLISTGIVILLLLAELARWDSLGILLAPGMAGAFLLFPQGIHGNWPLAYLGFAMIIDVLLYGWPVLGFWRSFRYVRAKPWLKAQALRSIRALEGRADEEFRERNYEAAERDFSTLTTHDPSNISAHFLLAQSLFRQAKYAAAIDAYEKARTLDQARRLLSLDKKRMLRDQLARAYVANGEAEKARVLLEGAVRDDAEYAPNYYNLACALAQIRDVDGMLRNLSLAFDRKKRTLEGGRLPDPRSDRAFREYIRDDRFMKLMEETL